MKLLPKSEAIFGFIVLCISSYSSAELSPDQHIAKVTGITLYNQFKAISATPFLRIASDAGDSEAQYHLGESIRKNKRYMTFEAYSAYEAAALQGDIYAMIRLTQEKSDLCVAMNNCPKGRKRPGEWGKMALEAATTRASEGDAEAMYLRYVVTGDHEWLDKAAHNGFAYAQYFSGVLYRQGHGFFITPSRRAETVEKLMKSSAEGGYPQGMLEYGAILAEKNDLQGYRFWNEKAAATGYVTGVFSHGWNLGKQPSEFGYTNDSVKSYALLSLLLELDGGGGMSDIVNFVLPEILAKMTEEQIEQSRSFAQEWRKTHPPLSFFPEKL